MKKRVFAVILGSVMAVSLMACGTKENETKDGTKTYTVGISQFAEHASLDNCREGFIEGLKEAGLRKERILRSKRRMRRPIREQQSRSVMDLFQTMWI